MKMVYCAGGSVNWYAMAYQVWPRFALWLWGSRVYHFFCQWRNPGCNTCWRVREGIDCWGDP